MRKFCLREVREEKGFSQRQLAETAGISRGRLRRLEDGGFETASVTELKRICDALGLGLEEFFRKQEGWKENPFLSHAGTASVCLESIKSGYRIVSLLPPCADLFFGKIFVLPRKTVISSENLHVKKILLVGLIGILRVEVEGEIYEVKAGDNLLFDGRAPYRIENPLLRESVAFLITVPGLAPPSQRSE